MIVFETTGGVPVVPTVEPTVASMTPSPSPSQTVQTSSKSVAPWVVLAIGIVSLLIAAVIAVFILRCKRQAKTLETTREIVDPLQSVGTADVETFHTAQSSSFSQLDSVSDKSSLVNSLGQRHAYHSPCTSVSSAPQSLSPIFRNLNAHDSSPLSGLSVVAPSYSSRNGHAGSSGFLVANVDEEAPCNRPSTSCPPRYSLAIASGSVLSVRPAFGNGKT